METTQLIKCARESSGNCSEDEDMKCLIKTEVFSFLFMHSIGYQQAVYLRVIQHVK